jgi:hypothetical protein
MMKHALELKGKMQGVKEQLAAEQIEASSGGGMVTVVVNGKMELISLTIDPDIIDKDDPEMLETLIRAAVNEGVAKAHELVQSKMTELTGGMDIPGLTS